MEGVVNRIFVVAAMVVSLSACDYDNGLSSRIHDCESKGMVVKSAQWGAWGWQVVCIKPESK